VSVQLVSKISNLCGHDPPTSRTDGRTDGQTTCDRNTALCTKVHRAVKTETEPKKSEIKEFRWRSAEMKQIFSFVSVLSDRTARTPPRTVFHSTPLASRSRHLRHLGCQASPTQIPGNAYGFWGRTVASKLLISVAVTQSLCRVLPA